MRGVLKDKKLRYTFEHPYDFSRKLMQLVKLKVVKVLNQQVTTQIDLIANPRYLRKKFYLQHFPSLLGPDSVGVGNHMPPPRRPSPAGGNDCRSKKSMEGNPPPDSRTLPFSSLVAPHRGWPPPPPGWLTKRMFQFIFLAK